MTASRVDVAALEAALKEASEITPLPWAANFDGQIADADRDLIADGIDDCDAALIVAAVNHLPALVALVRAVEAFAEAAEGDAKDWTKAADAWGPESLSRQRYLDRALSSRRHARALRSAVGAALNPQETGR